MSVPAVGPVVDPFGPAPRAGCRVEDDRLHLRLVTADPDVVAGARRASGNGGPAGLDAWCRAVLAVGARAVSTAGATAGTDLLAARVDAMAALVAGTAERAVADLASAVGRAADPVTGTVAVAVRDALGCLGTDLEALVAGEDAPLRVAVGRAVRQATADAAGRVERGLEQNARAVRAVLDPADPAGAVALLHREVRRVAEESHRDLTGQIAHVREAVAAASATAGVMHRTAVKGAAWEEQVVAAVTDVAAGAGLGDTVEPTGTSAGATGGRRGDAVLTVARAAAHGLDVRVAVEAKDSRLSSAAWARELDEAARNRSAGGAVGVVRGAALMPGRSPLLVLGPTRIVVAWGGDRDDGAWLKAVLLLVRAAAVERALAAAVPDLDRGALASAVHTALEGLARFDDLHRAAAAARRGLDQVTSVAERLCADLTRHLAEAARLLGPTLP